MKNSKAYCICFIVCFSMLPVRPANAEETIVRDVVGSGGKMSTNTEYQLVHTIGQPVVNMVSNTDHIHEQGFWYLPWFYVTGVEEDLMPMACRLDQNYPNPFNPVTTIGFALVKPSHVRLRIYDVAGRLVMTAVDRQMGAGEHKVELRASGLSSGIYLYRLTADRFEETKKMVVLR